MPGDLREQSRRPSRRNGAGREEHGDRQLAHTLGQVEKEAKALLVHEVGVVDRHEQRRLVAHRDAQAVDLVDSGEARVGAVAVERRRMSDRGPEQL